ncbi:MAG: DUF4190 domain-containing protein, partial [Flavobacteriales bacterium]
NTIASETAVTRNTSSDNQKNTPSVKMSVQQPITQTAAKSEKARAIPSLLSEILQPQGMVANSPFSANEDTPHTPTSSILSLVFGVLFFVPFFTTSMWALIGLAFPILAIVFGAVGISKTRRDNQLKGKGLAIAGLILGIIGLLMILGLFLLLSFAFPL